MQEYHENFGSGTIIDIIKHQLMNMIFNRSSSKFMYNHELRKFNNIYFLSEDDRRGTQPTKFFIFLLLCRALDKSPDNFSCVSLDRPNDSREEHEG
ncbi:hypothetical protein BgiBS90_022692 [Biomphalaria glabrata]|nr:hypothetical protein BgiBS90_022692 [Biomphalaria glabrata]